jgi:hypothetical protein
VRLALVVLMFGCTGEQVVETTTDASSVADASECAPVTGNLLPDGDFSMGIGPWAPSSCERELVAGHCGRKALRVFNIKGQARLRRVYTAVLPRATNLRLRAWFRKSTGAPPDGPPSVFARTYSKSADGGEVYEDHKASGSLGSEWKLTDVVFTVPVDQTSWELFVDQFMEVTTTPREFEVSDISITKE